MDPTTLTSIATATVSVLAPYLKKAAEKAGKKLGSFAASRSWQKAKEIYEKLNGALASHEPVAASFQRLVESPDNPKCQTEMIERLAAMLHTDQILAQNLASLLKEATAAGADAEFHTNIQGEVQKIVQIGTVRGDVNL